MSTPDRRGMLDRADQALSIRRQCMLLGIARSGVYRPPRPANDNDIALMPRIDELFTAWPFLGSRRMTAMLKAAGLQINRKRVQRLMRKMGIAALGPKPNTRRPAPGHKIYPYLLRNMTIDRPNQVWAADITYLPIGRGFLYLVAIIDWASRAVLAWCCRIRWTSRSAWRLWKRRWQSTARRRFQRDAKHRRDNTDQGGQFTSVAFTGALATAKIKISMDVCGRWMDTVFIERLWRSLKHEDIYLKGYADGREAKAGIASWIAFYNDRRLHQAQGYRPPMAVWRERMQAAKAVDMVDNADALTTCSQQQQTESLAA